jgi:hypothetical protein
MLLNEILAQDYLPKQYLEFLKKYKNHTGLYINFNNSISDNTTKTVNTDVSISGEESSVHIHDDFTGVYAYPIELVLNPNFKVFSYGTNFKNLRVLQDTSKNKLIVSNLKMEQVNNLLIKIFGEHKGNTTFMRVKEFMKSRYIPIRAGRLFIQAIQVHVEDITRTNHRSGQDQTNLLLKIGIDAVEDLANSSAEASISIHEPKQILFLNRGAYKVIEVFKLHNDPIVTRADYFNSKYPFGSSRTVLKLAKMIFHKLNIRMGKYTIEMPNTRGDIVLNSITVNDINNKFNTTIHFWDSSEKVNNALSYDRSITINVRLTNLINNTTKKFVGLSVKDNTKTFAEISDSIAKKIKLWIKTNKLNEYL